MVRVGKPAPDWANVVKGARSPDDEARPTAAWWTKRLRVVRCDIKGLRFCALQVTLRYQGQRQRVGLHDRSGINCSPIQDWHSVILKLDLAVWRHALLVDGFADNGLQIGKYAHRLGTLTSAG